MNDELSPIEKILKDRAVSRLEEAVNNSTLANRRYIAGRMFSHFEITKDDLENVRNVNDLLNLAVKKTIENLSEDFYAQEVQQFVARTDALQRQLDELKGTVEGDQQ